MAVQGARQPVCARLSPARHQRRHRAVSRQSVGRSRSSIRRRRASNLGGFGMSERHTASTAVRSSRSCPSLRAITAAGAFDIEFNLSGNCVYELHVFTLYLWRSCGGVFCGGCMKEAETGLGQPTTLCLCLKLRSF